jgi:cardiolipin synthase C
MILIAIMTLIFAAWAVVRAMSRLPSLAGRTESAAFTDTGLTQLGQAVEAAVTDRCCISGIRMLTDGESAFATRIMLARAAEVSLDLQYYIWHNDIAGAMLFDELRLAADRGVRVRLLLDDNSTVGLDPELAAFGSHPNIEVRLFNPFVLRKARLLGYLTDFARLNRRMHNKTFTADNQATIIGGRNIGDEYFGAGDGELFVDLDVLAIGPVVRETSADFDRYWASNSSYPSELILPQAEPGALVDLKAAAVLAKSKPHMNAYLDTVRRSIFADDLLQRKLVSEWAVVRLVSDDPAKGLGKAASSALLLPRLKAVLGNPSQKLGLISAYFVPTTVGVDALTNMRAEGVEITILTNALETTDVMVVHAGYAKWRKRLLQSGIQLFEMRNPMQRGGLAPRITALGSTGSGARGVGSALHAKTFTIDRSRVFIGSFNFDPRSINLNTECGFVIESAALASQIDAALDDQVPTRSYEVRLDVVGNLYWIEQGKCSAIRHDMEPGTSRLQRAMIAILSLLPIEWLL